MLENIILININCICLYRHTLLIFSYETARRCRAAKLNWREIFSIYSPDLPIPIAEKVRIVQNQTARKRSAKKITIQRGSRMNRVQAGNELAFRVGFSGHGGHLRVEPLYTAESDDAVNSLPDFVSVSFLLITMISKLSGKNLITSSKLGLLRLCCLCNLLLLRCLLSSICNNCVFLWI